MNRYNTNGNLPNHDIKIKRVRKAMKTGDYLETIQLIKAEMPDNLWHTATSEELILVANAINSAYQAGRKSTGAEVIDNKDVWINHLNRLIELPIRDVSMSKLDFYGYSNEETWNVSHWIRGDIQDAKELERYLLDHIDDTYFTGLRVPMLMNYFKKVNWQEIIDYKGEDKDD